MQQSPKFNYEPVVVSSTGGSWLSIGNASGYCFFTTPQAITVSANPAITLATGKYTAEIIVTSQSGSESVVVPVTLTIEPLSSSFFDADPGAFTFSMTPAGSTPAALPFRIQDAGKSTLVWSGSTSTVDGGNWLSLSPDAGTAPSIASVAVNPASLPGQGLVAGSFTGQVVLQTATGGSD